MEFMEVIEKVVSRLVAHAFEQGKNPIFSREFPPLVSAQGIRCTDLIVNKVYLCNFWEGSCRWPVSTRRSEWPVRD